MRVTLAITMLVAITVSACSDTDIPKAVYTNAQVDAIVREAIDKDRLSREGAEKQKLQDRVVAEKESKRLALKEAGQRILAIDQEEKRRARLLLSGDELARVEQIREVLKAEGLFGLDNGRYRRDDIHFAYYSDAAPLLRDDLFQAAESDKGGGTLKELAALLEWDSQDKIDAILDSAPALVWIGRLNAAKAFTSENEVTEKMIAKYRTDRYLRPLVIEYVTNGGAAKRAKSP